MADDDMLFQEEATVAGFLGVHINRKYDGSIHLTQSGLAKKIVDGLHLNDSSISSVERPCVLTFYQLISVVRKLTANSAIPLL